MLIRDLVEYLDNKYPEKTAEEYDQGKIGLVIGSNNITLKSVLFALDLNIDVIKEAISKDCNLIITHHPFLFNPITKILFDTDLGIAIKMLFDNNISVYSMHTNLDKATDGVSSVLAKKLGIDEVYHDRINSYMSFGRIEPLLLKNLVYKIKKDLKLTGVKVAGDLNKLVMSVGVIGGSGGTIEEINFARSNNVDCLITSELKLHIAQYATSKGLSLIEINHGAEAWVFESIKEQLTNRFNAKFEAYISEINTDPLIFM